MRYLLLILISIVAAPMFAAPGLTVHTRTERPPEMDVITIAEVGFHENQFALVLPRTWRFEADAEGSALKFYSDVNRAKIVVRFTHETPEAAMQSAEALRHLVAPHLPSAKLLEEFPTFSSGGKGKGALFSYSLNMRCRAAVFPTARGCATFLLTCSTNELSSEQTFSALLNSFRPIASQPLKDSAR